MIGMMDCMGMNYDKYLSAANIQKQIHIERVVTAHYSEFSSDYVYKGEQHDFWELVYVDKGKLDVIGDNKGYRLSQGDMIFHKPNEFHALSSTGENAPNVLIISFVSHSEAMSFFENRIICLSESDKKMLGVCLSEAKGFKSQLGIMYEPIQDENLEESLFGAEQMMYASLEGLLIQIYRSNLQNMNQVRSSMKIKKRVEASLVLSVIDFMKEWLDGKLKFEDICRTFYMSPTKLKMLFREVTGESIMKYYNRLKMERGKELIRENAYTFSEIAGLLGFDSIHYFSTSFKKTFGMTPTEYHSSVLARTEMGK